MLVHSGQALGKKPCTLHKQLFVHVRSIIACHFLNFLLSKTWSLLLPKRERERSQDNKTRRNALPNSFLTFGLFSPLKSDNFKICVPILFTTTKCECNSIILIHLTSEFIASSSLGRVHFNQWIHSKSSEIIGCTRDTSYCNAYKGRISIW
jgi:hypothetical protein